MWMMLLHLHVNLPANDDDYDDDVLKTAQRSLLSYKNIEQESQKSEFSQNI